MKFNTKNTFLIIILSISFATYKAQMYSEPKKTETKVDKPIKTVSPKDTGKSYLGAGFILNATASVNRGMSKGDYLLVYPNTSYRYNIKNSFGYRVGMGLGFQSRSFGMELPIMFCVDRFKVPDISSKNHLKISSIEIGLNQYWRFLKEKHFFMIGEYFAYHTLELADWQMHSLGMNFGYGYNILNRLNVSLRYKLNIFSRNYSYNNYMIIINKPEGEGGRINYIYSDYNSLQLVVRYDLINTRKIKSEKKKEPKKKKDDYEYMNTQNNYNPPPPPKATVDYSGYSDTDLNLALKEANTKSDLDAMLGIQKEIDKRKQLDEFSKFSYVQLEQELNKALDKEDYKRADMIKKEMAKRDTQKGMPSGNKPANDLESKSIEELTKLKDEAVQKEDYDKAKQIQDIINKKKP